MTPEQIEQAGEPSSVINDEATRFLEDAGGFGEAADEAAKIISDGLQKINDALAGRTTTTETPQTPSSGTSLFTAGQSNETPNVSTTKPPVQQEIVTIFVNVETGEPIPASMLLLNITENDDGSLSYNVVANASADTTVGAGDLVLNAIDNGDGTYSYDVFVNGTKGKKVGKDSIVIGTAKDGSYYVTTNGVLGAQIYKNGIVLGLDKNGEWNVFVNGKGGDTVDKETLVEGETPVVVIDADIVNALSKVATLDATASKKVTKEVELVYPETSRGEIPDESDYDKSRKNKPASTSPPKQPVEPRPIEPPKEEDLSKITIPADIDPLSLQDAIFAASDDLSEIEIIVDSDSEENQKRADDLKAYIERINPEVTVTIKRKTADPNQEYASGTKNAKRGDALVGERGRELVETNGGYMLVDEPTILPLDEGDRVHKNSDTEKILRRSKNAKANVSPAFAGGSPGGWNTPPSAVKSPKASKSSKTSWQKYFSQLFNWIEIRLDRLSAVTDNWTRQVKNAIGFVSQNKAIDKTIESIGDQIKALQEASKKYQAQADAVAKKTGLGKGVIDKIKNGTIDIDLYSEDKQKKIQEYQKWYEKVRETGDAIEDLQDQQKELNNQKLDSISKQYENVRSSIDATYNIEESNLELMKAQGKRIGADGYASMIDARKKSIESLKKEQADLTKEFNAQVASGALKEGSDAWYEYKNRIGELSVELNNANVELIGLNDAVKEIALTNLNYSLDSIREQSAEIQRTLDLIEAQGGEATEELYRNLMAIGKQEVANLNQQNEALQAQLTGLDPMSEKYQEILGKINANKSAIGDAMNSQEQWNDAITDLKIGELQKQKEELSEANDEYQRQLDLNKAIEELERSKSQRKTRILQDGQFKYVADQKDVADKQRDLDQKLHDEEMAKYDKMIEALEDNKKNDNVYPTPGATGNANALAGDMSIAGANQKSGEQSYIAMGLTPMSTQEIFPQIKRDDLAKFTSEFNTLDKKLGDMASIATMSNLAIMDKGSNLGGMSVQIEPGAIVINASGADANEVFSVFTAKLPNAFEQILHKK